jgi:asparagine synthase (glutamine-hydrolysing)
VLALATHLARRESLPPPIPATNRFPAVESTDEADWQELVVERLGLDDWHRLVFDDELDAVGPIATRGLERHGLLWPFNAFFHTPLLEAARGGSLLTGIGGDEQLGESRFARANDVLARRAKPELRDILRVGFALAPGFARAAVLRRRPPARFPWLRPEGQRQLIARWSAQAGREPRRYDRRVGWWPRLRSVRIGFHSLDLLAQDADASIVHPLSDPAFAAALAHEGGNPVTDRTTRMQALFRELLPPELLARPTKAQFDAAFWGRPSRELTSRWNGAGAPPDLVDPDRLRDEWGKVVPTPQSFTLLQAAWLAELVES